jgi:hypothetical protein
MGVLPSAEPHQRSDDANLVSAIVVPRNVAPNTLPKSREVLLEGFLARWLRKMVQFVDRRNGDGGRGGVEIGKLDRPRHEIQIALLDRSVQRGIQSVAKGIAEGRQALGLLLIAEALSHRHRIFEPAQCPEIIPVRVHRMGHVAFVAHRLRQ